MAVMTDKTYAPGVKSINALKRGLDVLMAVQNSSAITFTELQRQSLIPKATLVRILKTLHENGWVRHNEATGRYICTPKAGPPSAARDERVQLAALAQPFRIRLQSLVPWPTDLAVREGSSMLIVDPPDAAVTTLTANYRLLGFRPSMLRSSLGRCYLSFCPDEERQAILNLLNRSTNEADRAELRSNSIRRMVLETKGRGYALRDPSHTSFDSPERYGALAVPVLSGERLVACLSCSWLPALADVDGIVRAYLGELKDTARAIGHKLATTGCAIAEQG